jgi:aerobic carbon-monoxide dehydrogenase small subunit
MERFVSVSMTVNDERVERRIEARTHLVDFLRAELGLLSARVGCEHGVCGACTVRVDGEMVRGCLMLAVQLAGARVETIEHLSETGEIADLQRASKETRRRRKSGDGLAARDPPAPQAGL